MRKIIAGLVAGFAAYYGLKFLRDRYWGTTVATPRAPMSEADVLGAAPSAYGYLNALRSQYVKAMERYSDAEKLISDLEIKLSIDTGEYRRAEQADKPVIINRLSEIMRQRDAAVLDAELLLRNVITPIREKIIAEDARLKSAVVAPNIALDRSGKIPVL